MIEKKKGSAQDMAWAFRVERLVCGEDLVVLRVSGRIHAEHVDMLRELLGQEKGRVAIDLKEVILVDRGTGESAVAPWLDAGRPVALMAQRPLSISRPGLLVRTMPEDLETYARDLFAVLRELDSAGVEGIFVEGVPQEGLGLTIMDRLRRAAS